jgi:DNA gyrase subunit B
VVEQAAIAGILKPNFAVSQEQRLEAAAYIARRLDLLSEETERGWSGVPTEEGGLRFEREVRGVREAAFIDRALIHSADARKLDARAAHLQEVYVRAARFRRKDVVTDIRGPSALFRTVMAAGSKGVTMQRYKGLGEMNPQQLWETTLDTSARSLLQVKVRELDEAQEIFGRLMGDVVEPRREFIQQNALEVANLDV